MQPVVIKFKRIHSKAEIPKRATAQAAGYDLVAVDAEVNYEKGYIEYKTGLQVAVPSGYAMYLFPRSSISKTPHSLANSVGVIDSDYRGEILIRMRFNEYNCVDRENEVYSVGDRVAQAVILPTPEITYYEVDSLNETVRGKGGLGSTGR